MSRCWVVLTGVLLGSLSGSAASAQEVEVDAFRDHIGSYEKIVQIQRLSGLGELPPILEFLREDPSKLVRATAAVTLAGFREAASLEALQEALEDPEDWVRVSALAALSFLGPPGASDAIGGRAGDESARVRDAVPDALARLQPGRPIPFTTLASGTDSRIDEPLLKVVSSPEEWNGMWARHHPSEAPPQIDFSRERVIALFLGPRASEKAFIRVAEVEEKKDFLGVHIRQSHPGQTPHDPGGTHSPYHLVKVAAGPLAPHLVRTFSFASE